MRFSFPKMQCCPLHLLQSPARQTSGLIKEGDSGGPYWTFPQTPLGRKEKGISFFTHFFKLKKGLTTKLCG